MLTVDPLCCLAATLLGFVTMTSALAHDQPREVPISRDALAAFQHYTELEQPQFFALSADGTQHGYSYCPDGLCPHHTPADQLAREACEAAGGRGCRIVAAGKRVDGKFSEFGELTKDPMAEEMFRVTRDLVPEEQVSDEELLRIMSQHLYSFYGALAYSQELDRWGSAGQVDNVLLARDVALQRCGAADCAVLVETGPETLCVGYGINGGGPIFGTGKTDFSARKATERECAATAKGCSRIETTCSGRAPGG